MQAEQKSSSPSLSPFLAVLLVGLVFAVLYCIHKTWAVFGFWNMAGTFAVNLIALGAVGSCPPGRRERDGEVVFNPREWPQLIQFGINLLVGYYLYTLLQRPGLSLADHRFGLAHILLLTLIPVAASLYRLLRDRNDFVAIGRGQLRYRDNQTAMEFALDSIRSFEKSGNDLLLHLKEGASHVLPLSQMNFKSADSAALTAELEKHVPESAGAPGQDQPAG